MRLQLQRNGLFNNKALNNNKVWKQIYSQTFIIFINKLNTISYSSHTFPAIDPAPTIRVERIP